MLLHLSTKRLIYLIQDYFIASLPIFILFISSLLILFILRLINLL
jgi:hypothetical protein